MTIETLRRKPKLRLVATRPPERIYGSPEFIARGRNPGLEPPARFEPTIKGKFDVVI